MLAVQLNPAGEHAAVLIQVVAAAVGTDPSGLPGAVCGEIIPGVVHARPAGGHSPGRLQIIDRVPALQPAGLHLAVLRQEIPAGIHGVPSSLHRAGVAEIIPVSVQPQPAGLHFTGALVQIILLGIGEEPALLGLAVLVEEIPGAAVVGPGVLLHGVILIKIRDAVDGPP